MNDRNKSTFSKAAEGTMGVIWALVLVFIILPIGCVGCLSMLS